MTAKDSFGAPLIPIDSLGSVRTRDGSVEAVCWTHRGAGWDVIGPNGTGASARTKREAYALVRKLHHEHWAPIRARDLNDSSCWT